MNLETNFKDYEFDTYIKLLNVMQPNYIPRFTKKGFIKIKLDSNIFKEITNSWEKIFTWPVPKKYNLATTSESSDRKIKAYHFPDKQLMTKLHKDLQKMHESFCGVKLIPTFAHGFRMYVNGSGLNQHIDRNGSHIIGSIINVNQDVNEPWPLEIYDHDGHLHEMYLEPGDMLIYESAKLKHSRDKLFDGKYYCNIFFHYKPVGWDEYRSKWIDKFENELLNKLDEIVGK